MTAREQQTLDSLLRLVTDLKTENQSFRDEVRSQVNSVTQQVAQKHLPLSLEQEVINSTKTALSKAFADSMGGYNSPFQKYALNVVAKYQSSIESIFDYVVSEAIKTDEFKLRAREVLLNKIVKSMISGIDGSVEKTVQQMKQNAVFRSRLTLALNSLVEDFLKETSKV
ncbi:MAG: hypothetical protein IM613_17455 [Cytophagales bacterium]|nr:hypothetical protein [Cytophagales bacterium]